MKRSVVALLAIVGVLLAGCSSSGSPKSSPPAGGLNDQVSNSGPYQGVGLVPPRPRPSFTLTDTEGKTYSFASATANKATLLFFGYTSCPDVCPETMADIGNAMRALPAATAAKVTVVFVSTDVKHDTGPIIAKWIKNFSPGSKATFVGLHGTQAQVNAAQAAAHIFLAEDGGATHSTQVLFFGPDNYARDSFIFNDQLEEKQIVHDVPVVLGA